MDELLSFVSGEQPRLPRTWRANVAAAPVCSLTLGAVNKRQGGVGVSAATLLHQGYLLRLLHGVAADAGAPLQYSSVCLNVNFGATLHRDSNNDSESASTIVAGGEYEGGELFVEDEAGAATYVRGDGSVVRGENHDIRRCFLTFDGAERLHAVLPYTGFRISVVFFSLSPARLSSITNGKLQSLGFPLASTEQIRSLKPPKPYRIFVCTTRRSNTLGRHTLTTIFGDGSVGPDDVTLCLRDSQDVVDYEHYGLHFLVNEAAASENPLYGLPEQRRLCLSGRPAGSWNLFVDDDLQAIQRMEGMQWASLHDWIMTGFLAAEQHHALVGTEHQSGPTQLAPQRVPKTRSCVWLLLRRRTHC